MKRKLIAEIVKIAVNVVIVPLYLIKFFKEVAIIPQIDENGEVVLGKSYYYLSLYGEMCRARLEFLFWLALAVIVASIACSALSITVPDSKKTRITSYVLFSISVVIFLVLLTVACVLCFAK